MGREDHVRAVRRRQALDALRLEREREALLVEQLQELHAEMDGERLDAALLAELDPADAELVRAALGFGAAPDDVGEDDEDEQPDEQGGATGWEPDADAAAEAAAEAARLEAEIASSRRAQEALERYLELLPEPSPAGAAGRQAAEPGGEVDRV